MPSKSEIQPLIFRRYLSFRENSVLEFQVHSPFQKTFQRHHISTKHNAHQQLPCIPSNPGHELRCFAESEVTPTGSNGLLRNGVALLSLNLVLASYPKGYLTQRFICNS